MKYKLALVLAIFAIFTYSSGFSQTRKPLRRPDGTLVLPAHPGPIHHRKPIHRPHRRPLHVNIYLPKHPKGRPLPPPPGLRGGRPGLPPGLPK